MKIQIRVESWDPEHWVKTERSSHSSALDALFSSDNYPTIPMSSTSDSIQSKPIRVELSGDHVYLLASRPRAPQQQTESESETKTEIARFPTTENEYANANGTFLAGVTACENDYIRV